MMTHFPVDSKRRSLIALAIAKTPSGNLRSDTESSTGDLFTWE